MRISLDLSAVRLSFLCCLLVLMVVLGARALADVPQLMLATKWQPHDDPTDWWMSEKYDGVRGYWNGKQMLTRGGEIIVLPTALRAALPTFPLDGELWAGRGRFEATLAAVRDKQPGTGWQEIRYLVFDAPQKAGRFEARLQAIEHWLAQQAPSSIGIATQTRCLGRAHLQQTLDTIEVNGGEGVMLRAANSPYQAGRSKFLRKYKRFDDGEAQVVGYNPGKGKYTDMVGSLKVELSDGRRFAVGSGMSDAQRRNPPPIGSIITFKHHGWTRHHKPRFPVFWRIRKN